jgi:hypothetical protein
MWKCWVPLVVVVSLCPALLISFPGLCIVVKGEKHSDAGVVGPGTREKFRAHGDGCDSFEDLLVRPESSMLRCLLRLSYPPLLGKADKGGKTEKGSRNARRSSKTHS